MNRQLIRESVRLFGALHTAIVRLNQSGLTDAATVRRYRRLVALRTRAFRRWERRGGHLIEPEY